MALAQISRLGAQSVCLALVFVLGRRVGIPGWIRLDEIEPALDLTQYDLYGRGRPWRGAPNPYDPADTSGARRGSVGPSRPQMKGKDSMIKHLKGLAAVFALWGVLAFAALDFDLFVKVILVGVFLIASLYAYLIAAGDWE